MLHAVTHCIGLSLASQQLVEIIERIKSLAVFFCLDKPIDTAELYRENSARVKEIFGGRFRETI
jgi:ABC-type sugar transport system ATPase subunit